MWSDGTAEILQINESVVNSHIIMSVNSGFKLLALFFCWKLRFLLVADFLRSATFLVLCCQVFNCDTLPYICFVVFADGWQFQVTHKSVMDNYFLPFCVFSKEPICVRSSGNFASIRSISCLCDIHITVLI